MRAAPDELWTIDGQALQLGAFSNSYTAANDLWTWVGYQFLWTVWSDKTADMPFMARRLYQDEHDNPEVPTSDSYNKAYAGKSPNYQFLGMVDFHGKDIVANPATWTPVVDSATSSIPETFRGPDDSVPALVFAANRRRADAGRTGRAGFLLRFGAAGLRCAWLQRHDYGKDYPIDEFAEIRAISTRRAVVISRRNWRR